MDTRLMRGLFPVVLRSFSQPKVACNGNGVRLVTDSVVYQYPSTRRFQFFSSAAKNDVKQGQEEPDSEQGTAAPSGEETEVEKTLRLELNKAVSENATLLSKSRDFEV